MLAELKPKTAQINGRLWSARARDWAEVQEPQFRPLYQAALDRLGVAPGTRYLDAGCGSGLAAGLAAGRGARVSGLDAAEGLLAIARERAPGGDFRQGDLEELPFEDGAFDLVTGFNAFQYAGNPGAALGEAGRVTQRGGAVLVATWGDPNGMPLASVLAALKSLLPPPPPGTPGPFALSDEKALRQFAEGAGLRAEQIFDVQGEFVFASEAEALRGFNSAGIAVRAMELAGEQAVSEAHARAIAPFRLSDGSCRIGATYRCLVARPR